MGNNPGMGRAELLRRLFDAFNARDADAIAEHYHPAAELWLTDVYTPPGTVYHGREGLRTLLREALPKVGVARIDVEELREIGDSVLAKVTVTVGDAKRDGILLYTFDGDLIRRCEEFSYEEDAVAAATQPTVLTPREREVFELLARGRSGADVARELVLSPETVRTHVQNGTARLGAKTRVQAVALALERGEISV